MSNEIATYSMILSKLSLGKSGTECPTKTQILAINSLIVIDNASTYGANECVKIDDIRKKAETWNYYLTVSPTSMSFGAGGGSKQFTYSSYKRKVLDGVEQSGDISVSLKTTSASGTGFSISGTTVSASANEGTSNRTGTVTITQNESNKTATISLSQSRDTISSYGEWTISVSASPTSVSSSGGTSTITASAKRTIYWESGDVTEETGNPTLSTNLGSLSSTASPSTLTLGENTSTSSRTATITASYSGKSATCTVTQAGAEPTEDEYTFEIRKSDEEYTGKTSITFDVPASTVGWSGNYAYRSRKNGEQFANVSFSSSASWLHVESSGAYTVYHNTGSSSRSGTITLTQAESGLKCYVYINQSGYTPTYTFNVSPTNLSVTAAETNETLTVNSYKTVLKSDGSETTESLNYEFSSNASWVNAARTTTNTTYITVAQNLTTNQRSAKITLTQAESGAQVFTNVIQAGQQVVDNKLTLTSITYSNSIGYLFLPGQTPVEGETAYLGFIVPNTFTWKTSNGLAVNRGTIYAGDIGNIYVRENDRYKLVKSFQLQTGDQTISF